MPAVTVDKRLEPNSLGTYMEVIAQIDIANSGDTWCPGLRTIEHVSVNDGAITKAAPDTEEPPNVVFTTTGAVANALVRVVGYP